MSQPPRSQRVNFADSMDPPRLPSPAVEDYVNGGQHTGIAIPSRDEPPRFVDRAAAKRETTSHATFNLPASVHERLRLVASALRRSQSDIVAEAVAKELDQIVAGNSRVRAFLETDAEHQY